MGQMDNDTTGTDPELDQALARAIWRLIAEAVESAESAPTACGAAGGPGRVRGPGRPPVTRR
jgi:hypothetical protein